jgi:hypothetical protein
MEDRLFLEDIGKPYRTSAIGDARLWEVRHFRDDPTIPPLMYVVESRVGQQLLLGRHVCGRPKFNMIRYIAKSMVDLFFEELSRKDCSQYLLLEGAYPFDLQFSFGCAPPYDIHVLPTGFIKIGTAPGRDGTERQFREEAMIGAFRGGTWLIPQMAIASGETIAFFLSQGFTHHRPGEVYLFAAWGGVEGIRRIHRECQKFGVKLIPVFTQCIFELSKARNLPVRYGSELSVLAPGSMTTRDFYEKASERYQGTRMCSAGNPNESLEDPLQYSIHTLWEMETLKMDPKKEDWDAWTMDVRGKEVQKKVLEFRPALFDYFKKIWRNEDDE